MTASAPSVIVVGAGVIGAACAEALAEAGCRVSVLDAAFPGAGVTGAAMGHLVVMDDSEAQFALTSYSRGLWTERASALPAPLEDDACGTLWVAADDDELGLVQWKAAYYQDRGVEVEVTMEIQARVPGGIPEKTVRDGNGNRRTLEFKTFEAELLEPGRRDGGLGRG